MGSYFFRDCSLGGLECEEDLQAAKYISTKADYIEFEINDYTTEKGNYIKDYFKYIYQKFKFTDKLHKIKINIDKSIIESEVKEMLLEVQKYVNKFVFAKKFRKLPSWSNHFKKENNDPLKPENWDNDFLIKINFKDAKYRVKKVKFMNDKTPQLNYFGLFSLTKKYDSKQIAEFYINKQHSNYDFLLPINITSDNLIYFYEYLTHFVSTYKVNNLMLPIISLDFNIEDLESNFNSIKDKKNQVNKLLLFEKIISLYYNEKVTFFDLSFIIYLREEKVLTEFLDFLNSKLKDIENFVLRVYIATDITSNQVIILHNFLKAAIRFPKRTNSYIILYMFNKSIYSMSLKSELNPYSTSSVLSNDISSQLQSTHKKICLITNKISKYMFKFDIPYLSFLYATHSKYNIMRKLRKKTILFGVLNNLGIYPIKTVYEGESEEDKPSSISQSDDSQIFLNSYVKTKRKYIVKKVLNLNKEYIIPINNNPKNNKEINSDFVHSQFDYVFNLLRSNK